MACLSVKRLLVFHMQMRKFAPSIFEIFLQKYRTMMSPVSLVLLVKSVLLSVVRSMAFPLSTMATVL